MWVRDPPRALVVGGTHREFPEDFADPPAGRTPSETGDRPDSPPARGVAELDVATSPGVGYFTAREGLAAGSAVRGGDVLGHVDVLGVKVEVVSPADGIVSRVLADAGEAVEYGQELVRLDPSPSAAPVRES